MRAPFSSPAMNGPCHWITGWLMAGAAVHVRGPHLRGSLPPPAPPHHKFLHKTPRPDRSSLHTYVPCPLSTPPQLFAHIIGREGTKKKQIERDTECVLQIPRPRDPGPQNEIVVRGPSRRAVASAKTRVQLTMAAALQGGGGGRCACVRVRACAEGVDLGGGGRNGCRGQLGL